MTTLYEIEEAISSLPAEEYTQFTQWLTSFDAKRNQGSEKKSFVQFLLSAPRVDIDFDAERDRTDFGREIIL